MAVLSPPICPDKNAPWGKSMRKIRGWIMPNDDARSLLQTIEERIRSSEIDVQHRDVLIRLRSMIEEDLCIRAQSPTAEDQEPAA
jgi:hypothetical protein